MTDYFMKIIYSIEFQNYEIPYLNTNANKLIT